MVYIYREHDLYPSAKKCSVLETEVGCCGRIINSIDDPSDHTCRPVSRTARPNWNNMLWIHKVTCSVLHIVFEVKSHSHTKTEIVHAQSLDHYSAMQTHQSTFEELLAHVQHLQNSYHDLRNTMDIRKKSEEFPLLKTWMRGKLK